MFFPETHHLKYWLPTLFAFILGWYLLSIIRHRARLAKLGKRGVMKPYYLPFGIDTLMESFRRGKSNETFEFFSEYFAELGPTFELVVPGRHIIVTMEPENAKAILATQFHEFGKGEEFHGRWKWFLGDGIFAVDGTTWSDARALLRPQFKKQRISDIDIFERHISEMLSLLPTDGSTVDLLEWWYRFTLDASTDYLFGESVGSLRDPKSDFADAFTRIQEYQSILGSLGALWRLYRPAGIVEAMDTLNKFISPFVERAVSISKSEPSDDGEGKDFTHSLSIFTQDRKVLRDQLVSTLLAGRDTSACTLSWLFYELAYHPAVFNRLREEILKTVGRQGLPTYEDLKGMKYLQRCLNETLRLYPIVPFNVRTALVDTTLPRGGGPDGTEPIAVAAGMPVSYCAMCMQRREDLFGPTVNDFNPSRWETWTPVPWTYIPFNGGPRICLGQNFALTEMGYATVRMLQKFGAIEERSGMERGSHGYKTDVILSPLKGVKVGLIPAKD